MIEFHPGPDKVVKSTNTVFNIPPKREAKEPKVYTRKNPRLSKVQQAARAMETPQERAERLAAQVVAFKPQSMANFPSATPEARARDKAKQANLRGVSP